MGPTTLFGDGSTAVKASVGRYVAYEGTGLTQGFSPIYPYNLIDFRIWTDLNGDGVALTPDTGIPQFDEVGPSFNPNYGTSTITTEYDESMKRGTNIEYAAGVERQLRPRLGDQRNVAPSELQQLQLERQPQQLRGRLHACRDVHGGRVTPTCRRVPETLRSRSSTYGRAASLPEGTTT